MESFGIFMLLIAVFALLLTIVGGILMTIDQEKNYRTGKKIFIGSLISFFICLLVGFSICTGMY